MKAVQLQGYGGKELIQIADLPEPGLTLGSIIVDVHAVGVNPFDWKLAKGMFASVIPLSFPVILGGDFSGIVRDPGDSTFRKGEEVYGHAHILSGGSGSFAEVLSAKAQSVASKPKDLTHAEAGALPLVGVSSVQALVETIGLKGGMKILIHGGAGGIGSIAIQIARYLKAHVATTVAPEDAGYVKRIGADEVIDYTIQKFEDSLKEYDAVFDTVGGETYDRSFKVLKRGGIIVSMLEKPKTDFMETYGVTAVSQSTQVTRERLEKLNEFIEAAAIRVNVDRVFSLGETGDALEYLEKGHPKGKVVVKIR